ncbi:hypothetical protein ACWERI_34665 [Streptomyces collinus]
MVSCRQPPGTPPSGPILRENPALSAARSAIKNNWDTALQVTGIG